MGSEGKGTGMCTVVVRIHAYCSDSDSRPFIFYLCSWTGVVVVVIPNRGFNYHKVSFMRPSYGTVLGLPKLVPPFRLARPAGFDCCTRSVFRPSDGNRNR